MEHPCSMCGQAARVRVLENYAAGRQVAKDLCFSCAERHSGDTAREQIPMEHRASLGSLMVVAGVTIGLVGLVGDHVGIHGSPGFGWYKQSGLVLGALLICVGAFWRVDVIGIVGTIVLALAGSANLLHLEGTSGFGWKHQLALGLGLLLIGAGMFIRLYRRHAVHRSPSSRGHST